MLTPAEGVYPRTSEVSETVVYDDKTITQKSPPSFTNRHIVSLKGGYKALRLNKKHCVQENFLFGKYTHTFELGLTEPFSVACSHAFIVSAPSRTRRNVATAAAGVLPVRVLLPRLHAIPGTTTTVVYVFCELIIRTTPLPPLPRRTGKPPKR